LSGVRIRLSLVLAALVAAVLIVPSAASADYGKTSQYQVGISLNCDAPHSTVCDQFGGTGGFWGWYVFNNDGTGDAQLAGCGHTVGGIGGPGGAGAGHEDVDFTWTTGPANGPIASPNGLDFYITSDTTTFTGHGGGTATDVNVGDTQIPAYPGHYSFRPMAGVTAHITVALNPQH
jgi:hypothetical protein